MKNNLTEIVFILDRSGSMGGLESDTIGGYNKFLNEQKSVDGEATISTILFDDRYEILHNRVDIRNVKPITNKEYYVRGSTALYDAIGRAIDYIGSCLRQTKEEERPSKVIMVIITDGLENSSKEYSHFVIKKMIEHQKTKSSWEFLFLGANFDAEEFAETISIDRSRAATYDNSKEGVRANFDAMCHAMFCIREPDGQLDDSWKTKIKKEKK